MRSSDRFAPVLVIVALVSAVLAADALRGALVEQYLSAKRRQDTVLLPPPELSRLMSLGYRSALADLIFAHVLVAYGQHFQDKRRFDLAANYLTTITALDPKFRDPYRLADTLITLQPKPPPLEAYRAARRLQDKGLKEFPYDTELWLISGQFMAYLAAPQLPAPEAAEWRLEAARRLARSCELVGSNENIPHHCITAASLFNEAGRTDAARSFLERVLAVVDDPEIEGIAGGYLGHLAGQAERARVQERALRFRALWSKDLTFVSREMLLLLGPRFDTGACAGAPSNPGATCHTSFRAWGEAE